MKLGLGILSWRAHETLVATLRNYADRDLFGLFDEARIFFQEISDHDREIAAQYGLKAEGSGGNLGIEGGVRALVEGTRADLLLLLENDCPLVTDHATAKGTLSRAVADMQAHNLEVFRLRSRRHPGENFSRTDKYQRFFPVHSPLDTDVRIHKSHPLRACMMRTLRPRKADTFRAEAFHTECDPVARQPQALRISENGNVLTDSRFMNWSNQSVLVRPGFMTDVLFLGVTAHPSKRTIGGFQDLERAANRQWWRDLRVPIGMSDPGMFTHKRLDR